MNEVMQQVSSKATFFYKRVSPLLFFGYFIAATVFIAIEITNHEFPGGSVFLVVWFAFIFAILSLVFKHFCFDLLDKVYLNGDLLILKNGGQEEQIHLSNILNVSYAPMVNPPIISLTLLKPCKFGDEISFSAPICLLPFKKHPLAVHLIERIRTVKQSHKI